MRLIDVIRIAVRMLRTNLLRSLLTVMGIGVAISFIVTLIGFGYGLQTITIGSILQSKALLSLDIQADSKTGVNLSPQTAEEMRKLPEAVQVSPLIITSGQFHLTGQVATQLAAVAIEAGNQSYLEMEGVEIRTGKAYQDDARQVVISPSALELINIRNQQAVGRSINLTYTDPNNANDLKRLDNLLVVGITGPTDAPTIYLPHQLVNPDGQTKITTVKVVARDRAGILAIRNAAMGKGYVVESLIDTLDEARRVFRYATIGLVTFGTIALIVASIGMFNTLTIALIERTREIGIMKAVGVTDSAVRRLFLAEAAIIGFLGGLSGIIIGMTIGLAIELSINQIAINSQALPLDLFQYPPFFILGIMIFPVILAMVTGLYPAIRAARLNPLRALRYE